MAIQFILGRSGTGKTTYCINAIVEELLTDHHEPLIFLVPEQATYQAEKAILSGRGIDGYNRLNVLSFDRLEFLLLEKNTARESISRIGRQMIIHRILRENAEKLKIFRSSAGLPGLSRQMAQTIEEIHRYAGSLESLDALIEDLQKNKENSSAFLKFGDIRLILGEYLKFVENDFYDPDVQLLSVCRSIAKSDLLLGAKLWIDGFAGFTGTEFAILAELLKTAADSQIALCLDPVRIDLENPGKEKINRADLFSPTAQTFAELTEIVKKVKIPLLKPVILEKTCRFACPELAHVEKNIFETKSSKLKSAENIHVISASNERAEVQFAAREIVQLVRDKGLRYRDIAVIASDIENYHHYIRAYFDDYKIPFFIDKRKPLSNHPVVELICSALKIVTEGFAHHDIFAYLKTDLVLISRLEIDMLENYCIAFGISNNDWLDSKQWQFAGKGDEEFDEEKINQIRTRSISALLELKQKLHEEKVTAEQFAKAVFDFLDSLEVRNTINKWIEKARENADFETVDEHQQFYNKLIDVFDELVEIFAGRAMSPADFYSILNSAFSQLTLAFIPPTLDQVLIGSVERSRHPDLKAVFLIGATQKQFPVPISQGGILSDDDRNIAESLDFPLAGSVDRTLCERQYLAYISFTRPSEILYIIYPSIDEKGGSVPRSQFIGDLESLFENLREKPIVSSLMDFDNIFSENELADLLCERFGKDIQESDLNSDFMETGFLDEIYSDEQLAEMGRNVSSAIEYENRASLDEKIVGDIFEKKLKGSATSLGTFAECPYRYFARYILDLQKRKEFSFEPLDLGKYYHGVLDALIKRFNEEKKDIAAIDDDALIKILNEEMEKFIRLDAFLSHFIKRRPYNEFIINSACDTLRDFVPAMAQMIRAGSFRPRFSETAFGYVKENAGMLGDFEIKLPDNRVITLSGKIDRLDIAEKDNETKVVVFDYKTRETKFNWSKFYHGLDVQLPVYLLAALNATKSDFKNVIGAFYLPITTKLEKANPDELTKEEIKFSYKANGIFNGQYFELLDRGAAQDSKFYNFYVTKDGQPYGNYAVRGILKDYDYKKVLKYSYNIITSLAIKIISGKINVSPYRLNNKSPCENCDYLPVCRFDWQINEYNYLESAGKMQVLENIGGSDA